MADKTTDKSADKAEEILKRVRRMEISTRKTVETILSGQYHTRFKGQGMQFADLREYTAGDDIRHIDWKVTARTQYAHIKKYEEERDLTIYLMVDVSASGLFGSGKVTKAEALAEVCALLAFSAVKNNDRVGLILFSDKVIKHVPPRKGRSHAMRLLSDILHPHEENQGTNINAALEFFLSVAKHSCIAFLATDFYDKNFERSLRKAGKKHDVIGLRMKDPRELKMPKIGWIEMEDAESGETFWVDSRSYLFQTGFEKENANFEKELEGIFNRANVNCIDMQTNEDYFNKVVQFFKQRKKGR